MLDRITSAIWLRTLVSDTGKLFLAGWLKRQFIWWHHRVFPASCDFFLICYISFLYSLKHQNRWESLEVPRHATQPCVGERSSSCTKSWLNVPYKILQGSLIYQGKQWNKQRQLWNISPILKVYVQYLARSNNQ